jgi:hypothetical protein
VITVTSKFSELRSFNLLEIISADRLRETCVTLSSLVCSSIVLLDLCVKLIATKQKRKIAITEYDIFFIGLFFKLIIVIKFFRVKIASSLGDPQ